MPEYKPFEEEFKNKEIVPLSKFLKERGDNAPPRSFVVTALSPNKYANWTFVCEHGFKVLVYEDSPIFNDIESFLERASTNGDALFVKILDTSNAHWTFVIDTNESATYEKTKFGYRLAIGKPKSTPKKKTSTSRKRKADKNSPSLPSTEDARRGQKSPDAGVVNPVHDDSIAGQG